MKTCSITAAVVCACLLGSACPALSAGPDWKVSIELNDGSRIVGEPAFKSIRFQADADERDVPLRSFHSAWLGEDGWVAHTEQEGSLSGKILTESLGVTTIVGRVNVPVRLAVGLEVFPTTFDVELPARENLVLYLNFDRNGGRRARNLASPRHLAEVRAATWIPDGKRNGAYEFKGDAQLVIPHHPELCPESYTLAAWVLPQDTKGPWRHVISKTSDSFYRGYSLCRYPDENGNLCFYVGNYNSAAAKQQVPHDQWIHVAGVCDGQQVRLYVNGEPSPPAPLAKGRARHTETPLIIGGFGGYNWIGRIDEVTLHRRALSIHEIEQLMLATSRREDE